MTGRWADPDIRDNVVEFLNFIREKTDIPVKGMIRLIGISASKYDYRIDRKGENNNHNGKTPRGHWSLNWEREAIISFAKKHPGEGYRRLS